MAHTPPTARNVAHRFQRYGRAFAGVAGLLFDTLGAPADPV